MVFSFTLYSHDHCPGLLVLPCCQPLPQHVLHRLGRLQSLGYRLCIDCLLFYHLADRKNTQHFYARISGTHPPESAPAASGNAAPGTPRVPSQPIWPGTSPNSTWPCRRTSLTKITAQYGFQGVSGALSAIGMSGSPCVFMAKTVQTRYTSRL
jgi:hypothetical protein